MSDTTDSESEFERFARRVLSKRKSDIPPPWREELHVSYFWEYSDIDSLDASMRSDPEDYPTHLQKSRRFSTSSGRHTSVNRRNAIDLTDTSEEESCCSLILDDETGEPNGTDTTVDSETEELTDTDTAKGESHYSLIVDGETEELTDTDTAKGESHYTSIADDLREKLSLQRRRDVDKLTALEMKSVVPALLEILEDVGLLLDTLLKRMKCHVKHRLLLMALKLSETPCQRIPPKDKKASTYLLHPAIPCQMTPVKGKRNIDSDESIGIYYNKDVQSSSILLYTYSNVVKHSSYAKNNIEAVKHPHVELERLSLPKLSLVELFMLLCKHTCALKSISSSSSDCEYSNYSESAESFSGAYTTDESDDCEHQYRHKNRCKKLREPPIHRKETRLDCEYVFENNAGVDSESEPRTQASYRKRKRKLCSLPPSHYEQMQVIMTSYVCCTSDDCDSSSLDESMWSSQSEKFSGNCHLVPKYGRSSRTKRLSARANVEKRRQAETDTSSSNS